MGSTSQHRYYTTSVLAGPICKMLSIEWSDVVAATEIQPTPVATSSLLVSARDYVRIWNTMISLTNVRNVSRLLGERLASGPAIPVLFAMSSAPNFATGLDRLTAFKHLFGPIRIAIRRSTTYCTIRIVPDAPDIALPPSFSSPQLVYLHAKARALSTRSFQPNAVSLPLPLEEREDLLDVFGRVPDEGEPLIRYSRDDMDIPFISDNPELWSSTEADLRAQERIVNHSQSMSERVKGVFLESFGVSKPTIALVCDRLQVSRSTLLRTLQSEGTTYQVILDETRNVLAIRYLKANVLTIQQIAHLVGYLDTNAFHRAFKKWTGATPREMREQLHSTAHE